MCEHVDAAWDQVVLAVDSKRSDLDGERVDLMNAEHVGRKTTCCQWLRWNYKNQKKTHKLAKYAHNHNTSDSTVFPGRDFAIVFYSKGIISLLKSGIAIISNLYSSCSSS